MKSGPTLNGATRCPARRNAPIRPVATVVLPLPDAGAATTTAGVTTTAPWLPLDTPMALAAHVHRVLDLGHLGHQIGGVHKSLRRIASGDHHVLVTGAPGEHRDHLVDRDPAPLERVGELVEHVE